MMTDFDKLIVKADWMRQMRKDGLTQRQQEIVCYWILEWAFFMGRPDYWGEEWTPKMREAFNTAENEIKWYNLGSYNG